MKRKREQRSNRPTKQQRLDTVELINKLEDGDEDSVNRLQQSDAQKAVDLAYEEAKLKIKREFRTLNPERVLPERRLQLEQRLEYEESKRDDRLAKIRTNASTKTAELEDKRAKRHHRQEVDEQIEECLDMPEFSDASWQTIGKFNCTTLRLSECEMSSIQRGRFNDVLQEMTEKGWRTKQQRKDIKDDSVKQNDASTTATASTASKVH